MNKRTISIFQLILTGFLWSIAGVFIKMIDMHPVALASVRSFIGALVILSFLKFRPKFTFSKAQIFGSISFVGTVTFFVLANKMTTSANAVLLQYAAPIYVTFLSYFILREKLRWFDFASIAGMIIGMGVFFSDGLSGGSMIGNMFGVLSGFAFASQAICMRLQKDGSNIETILLGCILTFLIGSPFLLTSPPTGSELTPLLILGVFQFGIPYLLYPIASKNATSLDLVFIPMIEPILNPVWVFFGTGERPSIYAYIGGSIIISMVIFKSIFSVKFPLKQEENNLEKMII
jgi:drug/metabolite transporter (DMT)-like permease